MIFQVLDSKDGCVGFYADGELYFNEAALDLTSTWSYSRHLKGADIDIASLFCEGKRLEEVAPSELKPQLLAINNKLASYKKSFINAKVSLSENCIYDLIPQRVIKEYCEIKNRITAHVLQAYPKPKEYEFYRRFNELIGDIRARELQVDRSILAGRLYDVQAKRLWEGVGAGGTHIKYNMFGSVTGRLTTEEGSFPALNLNKKLRDVVKPANNWFLEIDLNAAELRVAHALIGQKQVIGDFHEWSAKNIMRGELTRSEAKEAATKWLYNSQSALARKYDSELQKFYNKEALKAMYWVDGKVHTPFGRELECDEHHAISYLLQSTLIDLFHRQVIKIDDLLQDKKSFISMLVHDSVLIDLADEDKHLIPQINKVVSDTQWGIFPASIKVGSDYGTMKKVKLKDG